MFVDFNLVELVIGKVVFDDQVLRIHVFLQSRKMQVNANAVDIRVNIQTRLDQVIVQLVDVKVVVFFAVAGVSIHSISPIMF
jgi:preprotein translocase subunit SecB